MTPLYRKIYEELKAAILNGSLSAGQALPSSRTLALTKRVSRNTVLAAFAHLEAEGFIASRHGSGIYVRDIPLPELSNRDRMHKSAGIIIATNQKPQSKRKTISLRAGITDTEHFPFQEFSRLTARFYRSANELNLSYHSTGGYRPLQEAVSSYVRIKRGVQCVPEQVIITNGSQEGIFLAASFFLRQDKRVYLENPVYNGAKNIFQSLHGQLRFIDVDHEGMQVRNLPQKNGGLVYVTPSHQFPLGVTMSIARRLELLEKAARHKLIILEDDYDSDFRFNGDPISSLQSYDPYGNVVYLGTFSKVLYPGIRLGYLVMPEKYLNDFRQMRKVMNQDPALVQQAVVAEFIRRGSFFRHLKKMHGIYQGRKILMEQLLRDQLGDILFAEECHSGLHLVLRFRSKIASPKLRKQLAQDGIDIGLLSEHYQGNFSGEGLLCGFAALNEKEIALAVKALAGSMRKIANMDKNS